MQIDGHDMQDCGRTRDGDAVLKTVARRGHGPRSAHVVTPHRNNPALQVFWIFVEVCKETGKYIIPGAILGVYLYCLIGPERLEQLRVAISGLMKGAP